MPIAAAILGDDKKPSYSRITVKTSLLHARHPKKIRKVKMR